MAKDAMKKSIPFKVFWHPEPSNKKSILKIAKPDPPEQYKDCPNVSQLSMNSENEHALRIMHDFNHKNIVSMKAVGKTKPQKGSEISVFIGACAGPLVGHTFWSRIVDKLEVLPSVYFQKTVREIFDGLDFLWRNRTYHGNLTWQAILCEGPCTNTVKLFDFKKKESSLQQSQWEDWDAMIGMLQSAVDDYTAKFNGAPQELFVDEINELIHMMNHLPRVNILSTRQHVFENVFFWTPSARTKFMMVTVHKLINNDKFIEAVKKSDICGSQWDLPEKRLGVLNLSFEAVLKHCNTYRAGLKEEVKSFSPTDKMDCVKLLYAAYTHRNQIDVSPGIDIIFRSKFPKLFVGLYRISKSLDTTVGVDHPRDAADAAGPSKAMEE